RPGRRRVPFGHHVQRRGARPGPRGRFARSAARPAGPPPSRRRSHPRVAQPLSAPAFVPAVWLRNPHAQTVYSSILARAPHPAFTRERWDTPDGDFIDVDFTRGAEPGAPWVH